MLEISRAVFDEDTVNALIALGDLWIAEDISFGMVQNGKDDLHEPCYIAKVDGKIVGYAQGQYFTQEKKNSLIPIGSSCFDIEECYVHPAYRSQGIGKKLLEALQEEVSAKADFITLATPTKDYKRILRFYDEEMGMTFYNAYLVKKIK